MNSQTPYTPLARSAYGPAGRYRLYLAANHLLQVHEEYFVEHYQRFELRAIQAIICQRTRTREIITLLHLIALTVIVLIVHVVSIHLASPAAQLYCAGLIAVLAASMTVNHLRGPSCACFVQTVTGVHRLYALNRFGVADSVLARLCPQIESVQGRFDTGKLSAAETRQEVVDSAFPLPPPLPVVPAKKHCSGRLHVVLAALLAVDLLASLADLYQPMSGALETAYAVLMLVLLMGVLMAALITQTGSDLPLLAKTLTWITLGFIMFALTASAMVPILWKQVDAAELRLWGNVYSICGETALCFGFWRALRGWR
ncbi:MAG: hypothetical protein N3B01_08365 [Verrucomicrobiae bacterium]|nr:hypothetical protein [Verrucomicrobiae bacterium]